MEKDQNNLNLRMVQFNSDLGIEPAPEITDYQLAKADIFMQ